MTVLESNSKMNRVVAIPAFSLLMTVEEFAARLHKGVIMLKYLMRLGTSSSESQTPPLVSDAADCGI
jgi:hypothetical protein